MHIKNLEISNCKRIAVANVDFDGNLIKVAGMNEQGKTSFMNAVKFLYGGKGSMPKRVLTQGESEGYIKAIQSNGWSVTRMLNEGGGLTVRNEKGHPQAKPQAICDALCGSISFDPLEFSRMKPSEQSKVLMQLLGLDFADLDAEVTQHTEERMLIGRDRKQLQGELDGIHFDPDAPDEEVSAAGLTDELVRRQKHNAEIEKNKDKLEDVRLKFVSAKDKVKELENELAKWIETRDNLLKSGQQLKATCDDSKPLDEEETKEQLAKVDTVNAAVRAKRQHTDTADRLADKQAKYTEETETLANVQEEREKRIREADMPIEGLSFDSEGNVLYKGLPFDEEQLSSKQIARVSAAIGFALAPDPEQLQFMIIKDGSKFDKYSLEELAAEAERVDWQVLVEIVGEDGDIVIDDGKVKEQE